MFRVCFWGGAGGYVSSFLEGDVLPASAPVTCLFLRAGFFISKGTAYCVFLWSFKLHFHLKEEGAPTKLELLSGLCTHVETRAQTTTLYDNGGGKGAAARRTAHLKNNRCLRSL